MNKYLEVLARQYKKAKGIIEGDLNDPKFVEDLLYWIREMNEIGNKYTSYLDSLFIDFDKRECAEVGKSELDTVVGPYNTSIITDVTRRMGYIGRDRIIGGKLEVINSKPYLEVGSKEIEIPSYNFDTFMTQNVSSLEEVSNWEDLHNSRKTNIIVGAFGYAGDKDIYPKLNQIHLFQNNLDDRIIYDYSLIGDSYVVVAASRSNVKEKVKVKTR